MDGTTDTAVPPVSTNSADLSRCYDYCPSMADEFLTITIMQPNRQTPLSMLRAQRRISHKLAIVQALKQSTTHRVSNGFLAATLPFPDRLISSATWYDAMSMHRVRPQRVLDGVMHR